MNSRPERNRANQVTQFDLTPKAFANCRTLSGFDGCPVEFPGFSRCSNPGLQLANAFGVNLANAFAVLTNAFGVNFKLRHYRKSLSLDAYQWG